MASRFFRGGGSDSSSDSDSSDEEEIIEKRTGKVFARPDSEDEDETRVVKSKKTKLQEELKGHIDQIRNKRNNNDWVQVEEHYNAVVLTLTKNKLLNKSNPSVTPGNFIKCCAELADAAEEAFPKRKSLNRLASKSLTTVRSKLKKLLSEFNLEDQIAAFKENPEAFVEAEESAESESGSGSGSGSGSSSDSDSDDDGKSKAKKKTSAAKTAAKKAASSGSSSSSESDSGSDSEDDGKAKSKSKPKSAAAEENEDDSDFWPSSSESDSESEDEKPRGHTYTAADFLKKAPSTTKPEKKNKERRPKPQQQPKVEGDGDGDGEFVLAGSKTKQEKPLFGENEEVNEQSVLAKLIEILAQRGKKGVSSESIAYDLKRLRTEVQIHKLGLPLELKIAMCVIAANFDESNVTSSWSALTWHKVHDNVMELLGLLKQNENITIATSVNEEQENYSDTSKPLQIHGNVVSFVERLDDEYIRALQNTDPHSPDYVERLKDEGVIYNLICLCEQYAKRVGDDEDVCRVQLRRVEHIYFKREYVEIPKRHRPKFVNKDGEVEVMPIDESKPYYDVVDPAEEADISGLMARLCKHLYGPKSANRIRTRAILCHIYNHALLDRWHTARDLMLMSHLQESILNTDIPTQILYNRTMVQLGLCAFRNGKVSDAHAALYDIWAGSRVKELLAQGINNQKIDKTPEELKQEQRRQIPFHMHINMDMLECVYYISAMLLEVPNLARGVESRHRIISKPFRRQLEFHCKQTFTGPAESSREHILAAAMAMKAGNWKGCRDHILTLKIWKLIHNAEQVQSLITRKIQEESLRTYLFTYSGFYDSISLSTLSEMFELEDTAVHGVVSKMIINEELQASHDQPTHTLVIHRAEPTALQSLALQFADKTGQFVENNERLLDTQHGAYGYRDSRQTVSNQTSSSSSRPRRGRNNNRRSRF